LRIIPVGLAGTAAVSAGCVFVESTGGFFFFLNIWVIPLNALLEALSSLFMALLVTVLDLVVAFDAASVLMLSGMALSC
jgi:hypothetical protein